MPHHPIIQKEVDELLAKGAIEPLMGGAGFYSNIFAVPKHTGVYDSYSVLRDLITIYTYLLLQCLL